MDKKYIIGLDIGTTSVGWAVVNPKNFKIIKKGNHQLWGVRLFDEANTAEKRRIERNTRRRYDRRRQRIKLLQKEFKNEINKVDPDFFTKLKEFFYNDSDTKNKSLILNEDDKKIFNGYKTIYHLREDLINNKEKKDIRYIYLAIHHIIKYRGNFLYQNSNFNVNDLNINESLKSIFEEIYYVSDELEFNIENINKNFYLELENAIKEKSINDKKLLIKRTLDNKINKNFISEFTKLILGNKFSISKLLNLELDEDITINFKDSSYDDEYLKIERNIGDKIGIIVLLKELYDKNFLKSMFKDSGSTNISSLMVKRYNEHNNDLKYLKKLLKFDKNIYKKFFKDKIKNKKEELCIYRKYVNNQISDDDFRKELNKSLENILNLIDENTRFEYTTYYNKRIEQGIFLPKISSVDNGKYPYQFNKEELIKIIENQCKYYPFLAEKIIESNGKEVYKLVKLLTFRIPYYIGPLNTTTSEKNIKNNNAWLIKKDDKIQINPYNFDSIIDKEASAEKFITKMVSHCTYILDKEALPNNSILYSKFKVMNELKQIKINGIKMTNEFQHKIYDNLFLKTNSTITEEKFINYLKTTEEYNMYNDYTIEGYSADKKFANNMKSYIDFFGEGGIFEDTNYTLNDAEEIIRWITIFEDKDILESKVKKNYNNLSNEAVKLIISKKYSGWGNLSKELLTEVCINDKASKISKSIMDLMYETNENFMQILNNKEYKFQNEIDKLNKIENLNEINYSLVKNLATSPSTKRGIYQALKVVEEIVNYIGYEPENIMIEMVRSEDKKKNRKDNKKEYINKLYEKFKNQINGYNKLKKQLNDIDKIDSQKLFLYFIQEGKSLYTGLPLDIDRLEECEIDHIIPRTLIKDDSIDNKALVFRNENQEKSDSFVLPSNYRTDERKKWWKHLKDCDLISCKKFNNLCRDYYSPADIEGFINRQLVETRQITKHVANILNNFYKNTKIIYLHADLSSNYRKKYELFKYRDLNDYHHAHDAYLAAVLGEYKDKFLNITTDFNKLKELHKKLYNEGKYNELSYGYVINSIDNEFSTFDNETGEITFDADLFNKTIENTLYRNDILISRKTEIKTGEFYQQTKNKKGNKGVSLKKNLPTELYGAYTSQNVSYLALVKYKNKQKLIGIPIYIDLQSKQNKNLKINYIMNHLNLKSPDDFIILRDKIPFESLLNYKNQLIYIKGYSVAHKNCELCNANQLKIGKDNLIKWKHILNTILNNKKLSDNIKFDTNYILNLLKEILNFLLNQKDKYPLFYEKIKNIEKSIIIDDLNQEKMEKLILELIKLYSCKSITANLTEFGLGDTIGRLGGYNIEHAIIINKSVTGLMEYRDEF